MTPASPKPSACLRCDFASGHRGMDWCHACDGTGSVFRVGERVFSNTEKGYVAAAAAQAAP